MIIITLLCELCEFFISCDSEKSSFTFYLLAFYCKFNLIVINFRSEKHRSSLVYNTSPKHERHKCNTKDTNPTRVQHERHECNTSETQAKRVLNKCNKSATRVLHERHGCDTSAT